MFLARTGWKIRIPRGGLLICLAVFLLVLFTPMPFGGKIQNGVFELMALMVVFPLLLLASAGTPVVSGAKDTRRTVQRPRPCWQEGRRMI